MNDVEALTYQRQKVARTPESSGAFSSPGDRSASEARPANVSPPSWGPVGSPQPPSWTKIPVTLPFVSARQALGSLKPGLHLVCGPHGCGKTTFALQLAVEMALQSATVRLLLPSIHPSEAAFRIAGILARKPWWSMEEAPDSAERALDQLSGSRLDVLAMGQDIGQPWDSQPQLVVYDGAPEADALSIGREAKQRGAVFVATLPSATPRLSGLKGCEAALSVGASDRLLEASETTFRLHSSQDGTVEVDVPRNRRGLPTHFPIRFENGTLIDEPEEMVLELDDDDTPEL